MNNKVNHLHERCLRVVYSDKTLSFEKLSEIDRSVPIHIKNLQPLATEFFKESKNLVPTIFGEIFSKGRVLCSKREIHFSLYRNFVLSSTKNLGFSSKEAQRAFKLKCLSKGN